MKQIRKQFNKKIIRFQIIGFILIFFLFFNFNLVLATDITPPIASAPTNGAQILKSGNTSTSTIQINEAGNIYLVKNGTGPSATLLPSADLTNIVVSNSPTNYTFSAGTYNYNGVGVDNAVSSITVTPTGAGVITVNGTVVSSGSASSAISLTAGVEKTVEVVTTETNKAPILYTLRIIRGQTVSIGMSYQGGVVGYVLKPGDSGYVSGQTKGLIIASSDQGLNKYGCYGTLLSLYASQYLILGSGASNTNTIIAGCDTANIGAKVAHSYTGGGYNDWFLPSRDELYDIILNWQIIGSGLTVPQSYMSSSESNSQMYWVVAPELPANGTVYENSNQSKDNTTAVQVRPVRYFTATALPAYTTPTFSINGGMVASGTAVTITSSGATAIYYTTDGSVPTTSSTNQAVTPLVITGNMTVKAIAVKSGYNNAGATASFTVGYDWSNQINTLHNAFVGKSSATANTPYTLTVPSGLVDGVYDIVGVDTAGNISTTVPGWLTVDNTPPIPSAPTNGAQVLKSGNTSTSTVQINEAGNIYLVKNGTSISSQADLDSAVSNYDAFMGKSSAVANTPYTVTPVSNLVDGVYDIVAVDIAGNISPTVPGWLTVDNTLPTSTINAICSVSGNGCTTAGENANPQESYNVQSITGTATDNVGGSGISSVEISIKDINANTWYSGSSFSSGTEVYLTTSGTTTWNFDSSLMPLVINHIYQINIKSLDNALNEQSPVTSLSFKFTNSPPVVSNVTASEDSTGTVNVTYDVTDRESSQTTNYLFYNTGSTLNGTITDNATTLTVTDASLFPASGTILIDDEIINYGSKSGNILESLTHGYLNSTSVSHDTNTDIYLKAEGALGNGIGLSNLGTGKTISWLARTDFDGFESTDELIKVVANDGSTGSMIGSLTSAPFALDTKKPTAIVTFDAGIAGVTNSATITIPKPIDQSAVEYLISDNSATETNPINTGWTAITQNTTIPWTFDSDVEVKTLKYQYRDAYGNVTNENTISTPTPVSADSFLVQDASNPNIPTYDMYISWAQLSDITGFYSYNLEYATSSDNTTYGNYTSVISGGITDSTTSYYVQRGLDPNLFYRYRLGVVGTNGNTSVRTGAAVVTKPDGIQNYGEGSGIFISPPKVENIVPIQNADKTVSISYKLSDSSLAQKTSPSYEGYVFYNIGITLPSNDALSGDNLTVSDASKLASSGYVQINNEVIKYTNKTGNVLSGLTRGTWPFNVSTGRATRQNISFFAGTPVWIMAFNTTPISITNDTISSGQNGTISWDTSKETTLIGNSYSNVGIRVLIHDNQEASVGPLSTQSDYSEIGTLSILDLTISPILSANNIKSTSAYFTWTTEDYADSLIEYGTIDPDSEGAYNLSKINTEKVLNHSIYLSNLTPATKYYIKTTSINLNGDKIVSTSDFTTTSGPIISNVSSANNTTDTSAVITWTTDIPTTSYINYSKDASFLSPSRLGSVESVTNHSVTLTNLDSSTAYYFSVDGADADGNVGEDTNDNAYYTFTTNRDQTPPEISNISVPIKTSTEVAIVWNTNEIANSKVLYGLATNTYDNETDLVATPLTNHLVTISGLTENTTYYYVVVSADPNGNVATSLEQTFKTTTTDTVVVVNGGGIIGVAQDLYDALLAENNNYKAKYGTDVSLPVVSDIEVSDITAFGATVSFKANKDTIAFIDYGKDQNYGLLAADKNWSQTHTIKLDGLSLGTDYSFKVSVIDKSDNVGFSGNQTFTTKFLTEDLPDIQKVDNVEQFQAEIESTIESILPSLVPPFIDKPIVSDITENSATVTFRSNIKTYPIVSYATDSEYDQTKDNPYVAEMSDSSTKSVSHTLTLIGLKSNTKYHLMAKAFSLPQVIGKSDDITFTTEASKIQGSIIDVKNDSFTVVWTTDEPTSSIVQYKNIKTGIVSKIADDMKNNSHSIKIENLTPGTSYQVDISGMNAENNLVQSDNSLNVMTSTDNTPPVITNLKVDSTLIVGLTDKAQTIISWQTDEPSTSTVYYEEGSGPMDQPLSNKEEDTELTKNHVVILSSLKSGTVYRFTIESIDNANNIAKPPIRTIITPKKNESIVDVIFKNFDDTFNFINNVK